MSSAAVVVIGTGVMHAPVLGQLLTEIIAEGAARTLDEPRSRRATPVPLRRERTQPGTDARMMYAVDKETT